MQDPMRMAGVERRNTAALIYCFSHSQALAILT